MDMGLGSRVRPPLSSYATVVTTAAAAAAASSAAGACRMPPQQQHQHQSSGSESSNSSDNDETPAAVQQQQQQQQQQQGEQEASLTKATATAIGVAGAVVPASTVVQRQRSSDLDPFACIIALAIRSKVKAKLAVVPPLLILQRTTVTSRVTRTLMSFLTTGFSQDYYYMLEQPIEQAVEYYLCTSTIQLFSLALKGLEELRDDYKDMTALALKTVIESLQRALKNVPAQPKTPPTLLGRPWHQCEVDTLVSMVATMASMPESSHIWIDTIEHLLAARFQ